MENIPLLPVSGMTTLLALAIGDVSPRNHSVQGGIADFQLVLDLLRTHQWVHQVWQLVAEVLQVLVTHTTGGDLLSVTLLSVRLEASIGNDPESHPERSVIDSLLHAQISFLPTLVLSAISPKA